ncbi:MAG: dephospho-CoA kinase [Verrucomicrobia bacterium]|nr:dephospho-CoA kinase [Verrucomicrobiota bacterium]
MKTFGLTGGIGMGKSTAAELLLQRGVALSDSDLIARQVVEPGQPALSEIARAFGAEMLDGAGRLRRDELARRVFSDHAARERLEAILHPRIRAVWQARVAEWRAAGRPVGVAMIPLLFETHAQSQFDATICLACSAATQRARLLARGWTPEQIDQRNRAQWPIEKKMGLADYVVWTEGSLAVLAEQLARIIPGV